MQVLGQIMEECDLAEFVNLKLGSFCKIGDHV